MSQMTTTSAVGGGVTIEDLKQAVPKHLQSAVNQELVDTINGLQVDYEMAEVIRENFITYAKVLGEGKYKLQDYLNAVQYVTYKVMGYSNKDAYAKTFPQRYAALGLKGATEKEISAYVAMYNKGQLVNRVLQQSLISPWILNQDAFQKAINTQVELMTHASSEKVRCEAAHSILTTLKPPEVKKVEMEIGVKQDAGISELQATLRELAQAQIKRIEGGESAREISRVPVVPVIDAEFTEIQE